MSTNTLLIAVDPLLYFFPGCKTMDILKSRVLLQDAIFETHDFSGYRLIIFLDYGFQLAMAERLRPHIDGKVVLFFWNHLTLDHQRLLAQARQSEALDAIYHFDPLEAKRYQLLHNSSFYQPPAIPVSPDPQTAVFFGATDRGRKEKALLLKKQFEALGLTTRYHLLPGKGPAQTGYLPYPEYLTHVLQSRATLELMRPNQRGITLRTFESLFFPLKLITDNPAVSHYRFYDPNNIFLLQERSLKELPDFLQQPKMPITEKIRDFFLPENWCLRFLESAPDFEKYEYAPSLFSL